MQRFRFKARTNEGEVRKGVVEAQSEQSAVQVLRDQKMIIIELHELGNTKSLFSISQKVKFDDVVNFTRQLSTMIGAGLPLTDALSILQVQVPPALQSKVATCLGLLKADLHLQIPSNTTQRLFPGFISLS